MLALRTHWLSNQVCALISSVASAQQAGRVGFFVLLLTIYGPHSPRGAVVPSRQARHPLPANDAAALRLVGATIQQQRKQRRLSQHTLAALTGLDSSYISEIERGQRNVTVLSLLRIAEALHLPVSQLLAPLDTR